MICNKLSIQNTKILTLEENLGKRLDSIEQHVAKQKAGKIKSQKSKRKAVSPSVTLPSGHQVLQITDLNTLHEDSSVQLLVEQHLKQLADAKKSGTKIKFLSGASVEVLVSNQVKWPHEYIMRD